MNFVFYTKEELEKCGVYCWMNTINGRFYIGSTVDNFKKRKQCHINALRRNDHHSVTFQRSWNKYGEENFHFFILDILNKNKKEVRVKEQSYLDVLQPYNPKIGFNRSRKASINDIPVDKTRMRKLLGQPVIAYNLNGSFFKQFDSIAEAVELFKIDHSGIIGNCKNKTARYKQWMFKYFDGHIYPDQIEPYKLSLVGKKRLKETVDKIVFTRKTNGNSEKFQKHLDSLSSKRKGIKLSENHKNKISKSLTNKVRSEQHKINNGLAGRKPIMSFDWLGYPINQWNSLIEASDFFGVNKATLSPYINSGKSYKDNFLVFLPKGNNQIKETV